MGNVQNIVVGFFWATNESPDSTQWWWRVEQAIVWLGSYHRDGCRRWVDDDGTVVAAMLLRLTATNEQVLLVDHVEQLNQLSDLDPAMVARDADNGSSERDDGPTQSYTFSWCQCLCNGQRFRIIDSFWGKDRKTVIRELLRARKQELWRINLFSAVTGRQKRSFNGLCVSLSSYSNSSVIWCLFIKWISNILLILIWIPSFAKEQLIVASFATKHG